MSDAARLIENPLFVKHVRSRLRQRDLVPLAAAVLVVGALIVWGGSVTGTMQNGSAFAVLLAAQAIILHLLGPYATATSVVYARQTGIMDFHRISPETPLSIALGFSLGAPVREYILFACTVPFSLVFVAGGYPSPGALVVILLAMLVASVLHNCLAALVALTVGNLQQAVGNAVGAVVLLHIGGPFQAGVLSAVPVVVWALGGDLTAPDWMTFFGVDVPALVLCLAHQAVCFAFVLTALTRKLRSEFLPALSKPQAVGLLAALGFLVLGDAWWLGTSEFRAETGVPVMVVLYALALAAVMLSYTVTPRLGQFSRGVRRARKLGQAASLWSDDAPNWAPMAAFAGAIVVLGGFAALPGLTAAEQTDPLQGLASILAAAVAVTAYMSCHQYFVLAAPKGGLSYLALTVFLWWLVPLPIAGVLASLNSDGVTASMVASLSPLAGIGLAAVKDGPEISALAPVIAVIAPALVTVIFWFLRIGVEHLRREQALETGT